MNWDCFVPAPMEVVPEGSDEVMNWDCFVPAPMEVVPEGSDENGPCSVTVRDAFGATP